MACRAQFGDVALPLFRTRLALAGLLLFLLVFCGRPEAPQTVVARPDVVLFVIDTLRADHLSCYGYARGTSPNLDRFATTGVRCTTASAQSSWTAPSMVSMMTSRFVASDFKKMPSDKAVQPLAERLRDGGYRTVGFQFNVLLGHGSGFERGFDEYLVEPSLKELLERVEAKSDKPTFFYFHFVEPHDPYQPAPEFDIFQPVPLAPKRIDMLRDYLAERTPSRGQHEIRSSGICCRSSRNAARSPTRFSSSAPITANACGNTGKRSPPSGPTTPTACSRRSNARTTRCSTRACCTSR
jgi:Sulfatase